VQKSNSLLFIAMVLLLACAVVTLNSSAQNPSSPTNKNQNDSGSRGIGPGAQKPPAAQPDFSQNTWELPDDAAKTKNPVEATTESVEKGKALYLDRAKGNCIFCHGETGSGNEANAARMRRKPADLSNKERMTSMSDGEVFWKISKGITGIMPAGEKRMSEEERWNVVNYVRTLAKAPAQ
jgi:mono/diheme cytochrome c family protein